MSDAKPYSKETQLARGERRYHRKIAAPKSWQAIIDAKGNTCRLASPGACTGPVQYHHLVPRSQGGGDTAANIVPLCAPHHRCVTRRSRWHLRRLETLLNDDERSYVLGKLGDHGFERLFSTGGTT